MPPSALPAYAVSLEGEGSAEKEARPRRQRGARHQAGGVRRREVAGTRRCLLLSAVPRSTRAQVHQTCRFPQTGSARNRDSRKELKSALQRTSPGLRTWPPSPTDGNNERPHGNLQSLGSRRSLGALYTREITSFPQNTRRQVLLPSSSFKMHKPGLSEVADVPEVTHVESAGTGI